MVLWPRCPKQGIQFDLPLSQTGSAVLNRVWYYEPRDLNPDCEQSLSLLSLREANFERAFDRVVNERRVSFPDFPVKPASVYFVSCPKQGLEMEAVVLHRAGFLEYFCPKQGQDFKPLETPLYPNMDQIPPRDFTEGTSITGEVCQHYRCVFIALCIL